MATLNFHRLIIMGKVKVGIYCYFIADILTSFLEMFVESGPLPNMYFLSKWLSWQREGLVCENIKKSTPQKLYGG